MKRAPGEAAEAAVDDRMVRGLGEAEEALEGVVDDLMVRASSVVVVVVVDDPMNRALAELALLVAVYPL